MNRIALCFALEAEEEAETSLPRFTGANAAAALHLLAFALNASTDNRPDAALSAEGRAARFTGRVLTPVARRQCRKFHVSFVVRPVEHDLIIEKLSAAFDQVLAARAPTGEVQ